LLSLLADENFNGDITRGLRRRRPQVDLVRAQDVGLSGAQDPPILEWATQAGRIVLTQDLKTVPCYAYERVRAGLPMPGVWAVSGSVPIGQAIDDLLLLVDCSREGEWEGQVLFLPL
jgi:hypothetical protein